MATKARAQIHMDDHIIDNPELEKLLEERQELKFSVSEFHKADKSAKEKIRAIETAPPFRVGRFLITRQTTPPKAVAFETEESTRFNIKIAGEE